MTLEPLTPDDLPEVMRIERTPGYESLVGSWPPEAHEAELASADARYFGFRKGDGLSGFVMFSWNGLFAPAGTPKEIVDSVNREVLEILRMPDVVARLATLGVEPTGGTPEDFAAFHKSELERWGRIVREAGIPRQKLN